MTRVHKISLLALLMGITSSGFAMAPTEADNPGSHSTSVKPAAPAPSKADAGNADQPAASAASITEAELNTDGSVQPDSVPAAAAAAVSATAAPLGAAAAPTPLPTQSPITELAQRAVFAAPAGSAGAAEKPSAAEDSKGAGTVKPKTADMDTTDFKASSAAAAARVQPPVENPDPLEAIMGKLPNWAKGGRSDARAAHNARTEVTRFFECLANATNGLGWKHDGRLEKDRLAAAAANAAAPAGSGSAAAAGK